MEKNAKLLAATSSNTPRNPMGEMGGKPRDPMGIMGLGNSCGDHGNPGNFGFHRSPMDPIVALRNSGPWLISFYGICLYFSWLFFVK